MSKFPQSLYVDLILANLGLSEKKGNIEIIKPKLLVGIAHYIGGAESWNDLEKMATFTSDEKPIPEFKNILKDYSIGDVSNLFLNLFFKAGWRDRTKAGLVVEQTPRKIDEKAILEVLNAKGIFLDTVYVHFEKDSYQVLSYCPFSIKDKGNCNFGAAYSVKVYNWQNSQKSQKTLIDMLKKENRTS